MSGRRWFRVVVLVRTGQETAEPVVAVEQRQQRGPVAAALLAASIASRLDAQLRVRTAVRVRNENTPDAF